MSVLKEIIAKPMMNVERLQVDCRVVRASVEKVAKPIRQKAAKMVEDRPLLQLCFEYTQLLHLSRSTAVQNVDQLRPHIWNGTQ